MHSSKWVKNKAPILQNVKILAPVVININAVQLFYKRSKLDHVTAFFKIIYYSIYNFIIQKYCNIFILLISCLGKS